MPRPRSRADARAVALARSRARAAARTGTNDLRRFIRKFEKFPADLRREMRPMLKKTGETVLSQARSNSSWSRRIPASLRLSVSFTKRSAGVTLVSNRIRAPHARAYENLGRSGVFRAPTGNPPEPWVQHQSRPFLFRAADRTVRTSIDSEIGRIVDEVARAHGFG